jgi:hypothetical protein
MMARTLKLLFLLPLSVSAFAVANKQDLSVSQLLETHAAEIDRLKEKASQTVPVNEAPYLNPVFFLRYYLDNGDDPAAQESKLIETLEWRQGAGKSICQAAVQAVAAASYDNKWNNEPVAKAAPHGSLIAPFLQNNVITTTTSQGDLIYCIRAGQIDDKALMSAVSVQQMADFFLYVKEVNNMVINDRSLATDQLLCVLTANDLNGVKLVGGSADFRQALSTSSKTAASIYPSSLSGPTLLLNLPLLLSALVKLFTPLFPKEVRDRIKFEQGPLKTVTDMLTLVQPSSQERDTFLKEIDRMVYERA